ncbi:cytochrome c [Paenibacillus sp. MER TA 81-3]|uniref:c-type cytochrome n=1 Tax=Paenibacillus sp. MER TA 81-3 TaxID=2939573 RepID=UPI00203F389B|nr:cytochrome c [Paenibacillus sp. MER TA 81-3]MCM3342548.1 cytochrome c [Paenibacillus sp. MER TA 81-3]
MLKANLTFFLIVMIVLVITACSEGTDNQATNEGMTAPGDANALALYKKQCLSCHAADLSGKVGPGLQEIGSKLTEQQLIEIIHDGARGMPAFKKMLSAEEIQALSQWLSKNK